MWREIQSASRVACADPVTTREAVGRQADHRQVALEAAALVEHRGVDHPVDGDVHLVGTQPLQHGQRVAPCSSSLANEVWSKTATASRVARCSAMTQGSSPACPAGHGRRGVAGAKTLARSPAVLRSEDGAARGEQVVTSGEVRSGRIGLQFWRGQRIA